MIKAISFDIGGTLIKKSEKPSLLHVLSRALDVPYFSIKEAYRKHFVEHTRSLSWFCAQVNVQNAMDIDELVDRYYADKALADLYDDVTTTLSRLKQKGLFLMTISNKNYKNPANLSTYGLGDYFSKEIYSHDIQSAKPDLGIFRYAQQVSGARPEELLHVGDSVKADVQGAKNANWRAVHIQRSDASDCGRCLPIEADYTIYDLSALIPIIQRLIQERA